MPIKNPIYLECFKGLRSRSYQTMQELDQLSNIKGFSHIQVERNAIFHWDSLQFEIMITIPCWTKAYLELELYLGQLLAKFLYPSS